MAFFPTVEVLPAKVSNVVSKATATLRALAVEAVRLVRQTRLCWAM
jgi:hypothetical protein